MAPSPEQHYQDTLMRQRADYRGAFLAGARRLRWTADRLMAEREARLREALEWSIDRSQFHRERLSGLDTKSFTEADLPSLPIMNKSDMVNNFDGLVTDPILSMDLVNRHLDAMDGDAYLLDRYRVVTSSGTTGLRSPYVFGWDDWINLAVLITRWESDDESMIPPGSPIGTLFALNTRHVSGGLHAFFRDFSEEREEKLAHFPASLPVPEIVNGLNLAQPLSLRGYPSAIHLLAHEALAGRLHIHPRAVSTSGEQCTEAIRSSVREAWGVEIYDTWGCAEGVFAFPCSAGRAMHLPDDMAIVEPVDRNGNAVAFGEQADKILITNLYNRTQPMIRYEITDSMVVRDDPCECGCAHRRIDRIAGRTDSFFIYGGDVAVHYLGLDTILFGSESVAEFQVSQTERGLAVSLVTRGPTDLETLRLDFVDLLRKSGVANPEVTVVCETSLERMWSGKLKQFQPLV